MLHNLSPYRLKKPNFYHFFTPSYDIMHCCAISIWTSHFLGKLWDAWLQMVPVSMPLSALWPGFQGWSIFNIKLCRKWCKVVTPQTWNDLLEDVTSAESLTTFRRLLKTHLFRKSFPDYLLDINWLSPEDPAVVPLLRPFKNLLIARLVGLVELFVIGMG